MSSSPIRPHLDTLAATPGILKAMLAPATSEQLGWKPSADRWSIAEVLTHLIHTEENTVGLRVRRIVEEEQPVIVSYDQMEEYAKGTYSGCEGRAELDRFAQVREASLKWLRKVPEASFDRTGKHPECGTIRAREVLNLWAFHDLGHLRQIAELCRARMFWDGIGSLQRYYSVKP